MNIRIKAFAQFRDAIGDDKNMEMIDGSNLGTFFETLKDRSEKAKTMLFEIDGSLKPYVILMINGKRVDRKAVADILLRDGDEVALLPPVAGG
jgi:molybdopterin synthase sulfur carrier subunit